LTAGNGHALRRLAHAHGIQLSYTAQGGRRVRTPTSALLSTLVALGVPVGSDADAGPALTAAIEKRRAQPLEPVVVLSPAGMMSSQLVVPADLDPSRCRLTISCEDGAVLARPLVDLVAGHAPHQGGRGFVALALDLGGLDVPPGYHELTIEGLAVAAGALLLVAPPAPRHDVSRFGVFAPVYGLRGGADWGVGTFTELAQLADYVGALGGDMVGTLPMFPTFFARPVDPSPYLPVSRLFVNELFIDVTAVPELAASAAARTLVAATQFQRQAEQLSREPMVAYGEAMSLKREVLELCAAELFASRGQRREQYERFLGDHEQLESYADFRATAERLETSWRDWSSEAGSLAEDAVDPVASRYHRYVQFVAAEQLAAAARTDGNRAGLYLDLPVGVHPDGFDTWSNAASFASATVGAPPDRLAPQGQAWGFPPLHPEQIREDRYRYVISCYRHLLTHARAIRIDHFLGVQRLFWIPEGADATAGAYVRYRSEELRAIIALEAMRANAVIVGEDLGTVSADLRQTMDRDGILHTFVYQFDASAAAPFPQPRSPSMASLGSHDLPRFAAFWRGRDIDDRVTQGITTAAAAAAEHQERRGLVDAVAGMPNAELTDQTVRDAFVRCAGSLAAGPAPYVMIDLADLEGEVEPDNRPGTGPEADNWRRRLPRELDAVMADDDVGEVLSTIAEQRRHANPLGVSA
jgi:4-alpha-glucanotransferase